MAALLGLTESAAEESLNSMVVAKSVQAKIDRLDGIVDFTKSMDPNEVTKLEYLYEPWCLEQTSEFSQILIARELRQ